MKALESACINAKKQKKKKNFGSIRYSIGKINWCVLASSQQKKKKRKDKINLLSLSKISSKFIDEEEEKKKKTLYVYPTNPNSLCHVIIKLLQEYSLFKHGENVLERDGDSERG